MLDSHNQTATIRETTVTKGANSSKRSTRHFSRRADARAFTRRYTSSAMTGRLAVAIASARHFAGCVIPDGKGQQPLRDLEHGLGGIVAITSALVILVATSHYLQ